MAALQDTLDSLDLALVRFDRSLRLMAWNRPLFELLAYPRRLAAEGTSFLQFVAYNIERGEHGDRPPEQIIRDRLAHRFRNYSRRRPNGDLLTVRSRRLADGGFLKTFAVSPAGDARGELTPRERDVLHWAAQGKTAAETALILGIAEKTVDFHIANAIARLGSANKVQAVGRAVAAGLVKA